MSAPRGGPSAEKDAGLIEQVVALLTEHESRWTTHGYERLYDVIHCAGSCEWSLRQKALMTDDYCYEAHRQHVAEVIAAHVTAPGVREPHETGIATSRGYCYACPTPIEVGDWWRRERVGNAVPHVHRLVHHPHCPIPPATGRDA